MSHLRPAALVGGVWLVAEGQVLVLERAVGSSVGLLAPPGGLVEPGETPLEGAVRELREEAGVAISNPGLLRAWLWDRPDGTLHIHHYISAAPGLEIVLSDEHTGHRWMTPAGYAAYLVSAPNRPSKGGDVWLEEVLRDLDLVAEWIAGR